MSKWSSAFRDPRWQQKRLEIMQRDEFTCQSCEAKDKTLNVHHIYYEKNRAPWEYENDMLITWCEDCHTKRHELQKEVLRTLAVSGIEEVKAICFILETMHNDVLSIASIPFKGKKGITMLKKIQELC